MKSTDVNSTKAYSPYLAASVASLTLKAKASEFESATDPGRHPLETSIRYFCQGGQGWLFKILRAIVQSVLVQTTAASKVRRCWTPSDKSGACQADSPTCNCVSISVKFDSMDAPVKPAPDWAVPLMLGAGGLPLPAPQSLHPCITVHPSLQVESSPQVLNAI